MNEFFIDREVGEAKGFTSATSSSGFTYFLTFLGGEDDFIVDFFIDWLRRSGEFCPMVAYRFIGEISSSSAPTRVGL
jgi:hypothetical protein